MSEEEALGLLPKGEYPAVIIEAQNRVGKADPSKTYVVITVSIKSIKKEKEIEVYCTLPYMLKHAADSTGNTEKYDNRTLKLSDFVGKSCNVKVKIQEATEKFPIPKNAVWDFVQPKAHRFVCRETLTFDDSVPF
jgi:hypothetical protein